MALHVPIHSVNLISADFSRSRVTSLCFPGDMKFCSQKAGRQNWSMKKFHRYPAPMVSMECMMMVMMMMMMMMMTMTMTMTTTTTTRRTTLMICAGSVHPNGLCWVVGSCLWLPDNCRLQDRKTANVCFSMMISQLEEISHTLSPLNCFCSSRKQDKYVVPIGLA